MSASTVAVDGSTAQFNGSATWNLKAHRARPPPSPSPIRPARRSIPATYTLSTGNASFVWDGKGNDGTQWPAGTYKLTATAKDATGKDVAISTEIQGTVDSVDLTASPALLSIGGKNYTLDQIKRVVRPSVFRRRA